MNKPETSAGDLPRMEELIYKSDDFPLTDS